MFFCFYLYLHINLPIVILFGVVLLRSFQLYPPKSSSFRSDCELFGSYISLDCPSPPAPPCTTDIKRDPQVSFFFFLIALFICHFRSYVKAARKVFLLRSIHENLFHIHCNFLLCVIRTTTTTKTRGTFKLIHEKSCSRIHFYYFAHFFFVILLISLIFP